MTYCYIVILLLIYVLVSRTCYAYVVYLQKHSIFAKGTWNEVRQNLLNSSYLKWNIKIIQICNNLHKLRNFFLFCHLCFGHSCCVNQNNNHIINNGWTVTKVKCFHCFTFFYVVDMWKSCRHCHLIHIIHSHMPKKMMQSDIYYVKQPSSQLLPYEFQLSKFSPL